MKTWIAVLALLLIASAAAWGWHALALDPGSISVRFAGWRMDTSFVFALIALLLLWGIASLFWRLLIWPNAALRRRAQRRGRERIGAGLIALVEGRHEQAARELERAAHLVALRAPAEFARARAAQARGDRDAASAALNVAAQSAAPAALALRGQFLLEENRNSEVVALLKPHMNDSDFPPSAAQTLVAAALRSGDGNTAMTALSTLERSGTLSAQEFERMRTQALVAALDGARDLAQLNAQWSTLNRAQRRDEAVLIAFAQRSAAFGQPLAGISEIEGALRRGWSAPLIRAYGELGPAELAARLRQAEHWIDVAPNSADLFLTLGRLCSQSELWGKARAYLQRGLAIAPEPALWEAFGDACAGQGDAEAAQRGYRNALLQARGENVPTLPELARGALDTRASVFEERSEHGVPRLR